MLAVSSISWLENDVFLVAHTPSASEGDLPPATTYHIITRQPPSVIFQKLPEPCAPFGLNRSPPFQFMQRLKNFPPNLTDAIIVASTVSVDVGFITRSKTPLSSDFPAERVSNVFTTTMMADDSRRAQLPMTEDLTDTSAIGVGLDLSSKDKVLRPLPKEEHDTSPGPLPALMILNHEGILSTWWIVYAESIRQGTSFPGLAAIATSQPQQQATASPFGAPLNKPAAPAFGAASTPGSGFGGPSPFGKASSPWVASTPTPATTQTGGATFGQPSFGSSTPLGAASQGAAFGAAGGLGSRPSPWGTPSGAPPFGSPTSVVANRSPFAPGSASSVLGSNVSSSSQFPTSGGFASFASKPSGFLTNNNTESALGKTPAALSFGSNTGTDTSFAVTPNKDTGPSNDVLGGGTFQLGSTFKGDGSAANDGPRPSSDKLDAVSRGFFGDLGETRKDAGTPQIKDADMDDDDENAPAKTSTSSPESEKEVTTPVAKPAPPKFQWPSAPPSMGGLFSTQAQSKITPAAVENSEPASTTFGKPSPIPKPATTTPEDTPKKPEQAALPSIETSPRIKEEPHSDEDDISPLNETEAAPPEGYDTSDTPTASKGQDPPLPPESTSKTTYAPGDSSSSSKSSDDAPLPPDFLPAKSKLKEVESAQEQQPALPSEEDDEGSFEEGGDSGDDAEGSDEGREGLDDEGSGVDVAQEFSPTDHDKSPQVTPESSFGTAIDKTPPGGLFSRITRPQDGQKVKTLFGEVGKASVPYLPPPKQQESPRSPSPVRASRVLGDSLRPETGRSVSAPGPFKALDTRKQKLSQLAVPSKPQPSAQELRKQEQERLAAQQAKRAAEEEQDLSDREDERVREELATEVIPTKTLDPFLAHQDYIGDIDKPGIPGQIERVYRDINSMIDTLGLNARSLKAFVKGHEQLYKDGGRERADLEDDDWCLIEIAELKKIEDDISEQLAQGKTQDVPGKLNECRELRKGVTALRAKGNDIGRIIDTKSDPNAIESARSAPLRLDQANQQYELRKKVTRFQKLLAEAEENVTMLRAQLASREGSNGRGPPLKQPTVEAVTNTIMKMTSIVEKKSLDIDVLETQMRHLRFSSAASQSSREGSPFTPMSSRKKANSKLGASVLQNGRSHSPEFSRSVRGSPAKSVTEIPPEEIQLYRERARRRREVNEIMREAFSKTGPRISPLD